MSTPLSPSLYGSNAGYCKFGGEKLATLLRAFEAPIEGVLENQDIEFVHKMRVASRRIRAAMPLFQTCCPKRKYKKWLFEVKKVTRLLGEARDLDVQIAYVKNYVEKLNSPAEKTAMQPLLRKHQERRIIIQTTVANGLMELQDSGILSEMGKFWEDTAQNLEGATIDASVLEQAYWHISPKLDDFLALEKYVRQEDANLKHHEMRIKAKWLRYTLEVFASLYKNELREEIETVKTFQDVLGEMHDCDVWIGYLPKFLAESKEMQPAISSEEIEATLNFLSFIKDSKKKNYEQFVQMWDEQKRDDFFGKLRENARTGSVLNENKIKQVISNPNIRIAIISDIHANLQALETVIQDAESRGANIFLNAGDSIGFGAFPNEVLELLYLKKVVSVIGNFDLEVIKSDVKSKNEKKIALDFARKELNKTLESYLRSLPFEVTLEINDKIFFLVHGSPKSIEEHIYRDTPVERLRDLAKVANADLIIVGHSHEQYNRLVDGISFINPGSVGRPGDGKPQAAYAMVSFNPFQIELIRIDYDFEGAANGLRRKGLPESFAQMVIRGLPLEKIIQEDKTKKDEMVRDCDRVAKVCQDISKSYMQELEHCEQVEKLALTLFDALKPLHRLGSRERCWLECASILHDVGLSKGNGGAHHKLSMQLILNNPAFPFTSEERRIIASITRYHRKGFPKRKHYNLSTFDRVITRKMAQLSSILRVADGLDYAHESFVKSLKVTIGLNRIYVEYFASAQSSLDEQAFNKKKDLFEKVFRKKLVLTWTQQ
ncbi:MAG TPA: YfcE family phosphodiesterase [Candidatus Nanoarchaeia archaeon]|nr:YfcE family phosphodiesterase [Candidatus Nanoarchaeia archaeon]